MAVDFFFVLSGFIMSYTYFPVFQADGINAFIPFFLKRVARIFPLGLAMLAVILLLGSVASIWGRSDIFIDENVVHAGLASAILINVLHLQGLLPEYNLNGPSWSISVEMTAYLLFPILNLHRLPWPTTDRIDLLPRGNIGSCGRGGGAPPLRVRDLECSLQPRALPHGIWLRDAGLSAVSHPRMGTANRQRCLDLRCHGSIHRSLGHAARPARRAQLSFGRSGLGLEHWKREPDHVAPSTLFLWDDLVLDLSRPSHVSLARVGASATFPAGPCRTCIGLGVRLRRIGVGDPAGRARLPLC